MPQNLANFFISDNLLYNLLRSRLVCIFFLASTMFFLVSFNLKMSEYSIIKIASSYSESEPEMMNAHINDSCAEPVREWTEVRVPGQVRTVRVRTAKKPETHSNSSKITILLWTTYFGRTYSDDFYFFQEGRETFEKYSCRVSNCFVTANRSMLPHVSAVLFHATDLNSSDIPERVRQDQVWILYSMEPPRYAHFRWRLVASRFNWTMTYRSDSDVQVRYGDIVQIDNIPRVDSVKEIINRNRHGLVQVDNIPRINSVKKIHRKRHGAVWMVSNCKTESRRKAYVKELKKYFKVDVYGKCSRRKKCEPAQSEKCYELLKNYGFYLSFENSLCQDYVTEKFFNVLMYDVVPVVFGGANYTNLAPRDSFIDATQFPNPKDLAVYLTETLKNTTLYSSFFKWKNMYKVHLHSWMCDLCERLHENSSKIKMMPINLWSWWVPGAHCRKWTKKAGFQNIFKY